MRAATDTRVIDPDTRGPFSRRGGILSDLVLFGIVLFTNVDFGALGLASDSGVDAGKWLVLFPVWLAPAIVIPLSRSLPRTLRRSPLAWLVAWAVWSLATALWTLDLHQTVLIGLPTLTIVCFIAWYLTQYGWVRFLRVFAAGAVVFLWAGFVAEIIVGAQPGTGGRLTGLSFGPTDIGIVAALALVGGAALWASGTATMLGRACAASACVALLWANARGSMLSAGLALGIVVACRIGSWRAFVTAIVGSIVVVGLFVASGSGTARLTRSGNSKELTTLTGRTDVWPIALHLIGERPLFGYGTGTSETLFEEATREGLLWWEAFNAHNVFLTIALEQGFVGVVLFVPALLASAYRLRRSPWPLAFLVVILVNGMTEAMTERPTVAVAVLAAVATVAVRAGPAPEPPPVHASRRAPAQVRRARASRAPLAGTAPRG